MNSLTAANVKIFFTLLKPKTYSNFVVHHITKMKSKVGKYFFYFKRFIKSDNKRKVAKELSREIKKKGIIIGTKSLLHKKTFGNITDFDDESNLTLDLSIRNYNKKQKVVLPAITDPVVSIIIPMYNQVEYTYNCICSISSNCEYTNYEIIVADDNSTESTSLFSENFENLVLIRNEINLGFLKNCNNAASKAKGKYLVFLNNDTQVQKNWLEELLSCFERFENVGLVGSKLLYENGRLQEAGGIIWQDGSGWNYGNDDNPKRPEYNYVKEVDYVSGASIMITTYLWKKIGGFDEHFAPAYYEDTDLCFQVRKEGYKVLYQPFSSVVHFEGITHGTDVNKGVKKYQVVNQKKFVAKWKTVLQQKSQNGVTVFSERDRTTGKKHILVVDHYLPQVDRDAGSRCISNFIDSMLELGYDVKFLGENQNVPKAYMKSLQEKGVEVLYGIAFDFDDESWKGYLGQNINNFDAVLLSRAAVCLPILKFIKTVDYHGEVIYFGHDLGYLRLEQEAEEHRNSALLKKAKKIKAAEDFMYSHADISLVLSYDELDYLKKYIAKPLWYVPGYFFDVPQTISTYDEREGLLFVGGFNHPPNKDAMKWFLDDVYPQLSARNIPLTIVGSLVPDFILKYRERLKNINILSDLPGEELESIYAETRISIAPLLSGAGVKGKVIEAMAKGVPVVGTEIAFEGMPKDDGFIYRGIKTASGMVAEILRIYDDKVVWDKFSQFGKEYVRNNFNKENMKAVFKEIIEGAAHKK